MRFLCPGWKMERRQRRHMLFYMSARLSSNLEISSHAHSATWSAKRQQKMFSRCALTQVHISEEIILHVIFSWMTTLVEMVDSKNIFIIHLKVYIQQMQMKTKKKKRTATTKIKVNVYFCLKVPHDHVSCHRAAFEEYMSWRCFY